MSGVAVIIPAFNEGQRIGAVLQGVLSSQDVDVHEVIHEVIVVDDGSTDGTATVASSYGGVSVLRLPANSGKGRAMMEGLAFTGAPVVLFLDADLIGLGPGHIQGLLEPVIQGHADMTIGWIDGMPEAWVPYSGQRAMKRRIAESVDDLGRYHAEALLNQVASSVQVVRLLGVQHQHKIQKWGIRGLFSSVASVVDILSATGALAPLGILGAMLMIRRITNGR